MSTWQQVLQIFQQAQGGFVSGGEIARQLGVSRTAVWKAVQELRSRGYSIAAGTNRGYRLAGAPDPLSAPAVTRLLGRDFAGPVLFYEQVDSTNLAARRLAAQGEKGPLLVLANQQTGGRGRGGHLFFSPAHTGVYLTLLLPLPHGPGQPTPGQITTAAAVAAACAAEACVPGSRVQIKWVNDLFSQGRKVGGILTEGIADLETGHLQHILVGVGINLFCPAGGFPPPLEESAGYLAQPGQASRNHLAAALCRQLMEKLSAPPGAFMGEYRRRSLLLGKPVWVTQGDAAPFPATAQGIDGQGRLQLALPDGSTRLLAYGEASVRQQEGAGDPPAL